MTVYLVFCQFLLGEWWLSIRVYQNWKRKMRRNPGIWKIGIT
jgi:hypothetical protein